MARKKFCGIYKITSPNGRCYIGKAVDIYKRWSYYNSSNRKRQPLLFRSLNKYGRDAHIFEIIHECEEKWLNFLEMFYIRLYQSFDKKYGMNSTLGGDGIYGYKHTEETKIKIARYGENHHQFGKPRTPESREKMRNSHLGKTLSKETREKLSVAGKGRISPMRGRKLTQITLDKRYKVIINTQNGIFYNGYKEAEDSIGMINNTLGRKLKNIRKNNTPFIYA